MSNLIDVLEAVYSVGTDEPSWLQGIFDAWAPLFKTGLGLCGGYYDARSPTVVLRSVVATKACPIDPAYVIRVDHNLPVELVQQLFVHSPAFASVSERLGLGPGLRDHPSWRRYHPDYGDGIAIRASDTIGRGIMLFAPSRAIETTTAPRARVPLFVAAHIVAALRLREARDGGRGGLSAQEVEAVLSPEGRVLHATSEARAATTRNALASGVQQLDRARGRLRRKDPDAALAIWRGLVAGRWSLLDHFDTDGKRLVIARRNEPAAPEAPRLTSRERQLTAYAAAGHANKVIAYALGLTPSTVSTLLTRATRKFGVRSRVELIRAWRARR